MCHLQGTHGGFLSGLGVGTGWTPLLSLQGLEPLHSALPRPSQQAAEMSYTLHLEADSGLVYVSLRPWKPIAKLPALTITASFCSFERSSFYLFGKKKKTTLSVSLAWEDLHGLLTALSSSSQMTASLSDTPPPHLPTARSQP